MKSIFVICLMTVAVVATVNGDMINAAIAMGCSDKTLPLSGCSEAEFKEYQKKGCDALRTIRDRPQDATLDTVNVAVDNANKAKNCMAGADKIPNYGIMMQKMEEELKAKIPK